jgi:ribonuclease Z
MKGRLTILGTSSAIPTKDRNHAAIYLQFGGEAFLFDCGEGTQRQIQKAGLSFFKIDKIFITHLHGDHVLGLPGLLQTLDFHDKTYIEIYGTQGLKRLVELATTQCFYINTEDMTIQVGEIPTTDEPYLVCEGDNYTVKSIGLNHSVPCLGYAFEEKEKFKYDKAKVKQLGLKAQNFKELELTGKTRVGENTYSKEDLGFIQKGFKFVYITDTYLTPNMFKLTEGGADFVVIESTYFDENETAKEKKHLSFDLFRKEIYPIFKQQGVKKIILTHFSRRYKDLTPFEEAIKKYQMEEVYLAHDLMSFEF